MTAEQFAALVAWIAGLEDFSLSLVCRYTSEIVGPTHVDAVRRLAQAESERREIAELEREATS